MRRTEVRLSTDERPVLARFPRPARLAGYAALLAFALLYALPFLVQLATAFKSDPEAASHPLSLLPSNPTAAVFEKLTGTGESGEGVPFLRWLGNSTVVTVVVTLGRVLFDSAAGYALARLRFRGRALLVTFVVAVMAVPPVVLLIPKFLVLNTLGIFDTYTGMIVPLLFDAAGIFIMKQFFESIPREVEEAARIDGAGVGRIFWYVVLPMSRPALITVTLLSFQGSWNEFTHFLVATSDPDLETLNLGIARLVAGPLDGAQQFPLKLALATVSTIPVLIVYVIFQRQFVRSQLSSGVKG